MTSKLIQRQLSPARACLLAAALLPSSALAGDLLAFNTVRDRPDIEGVDATTWLGRTPRDSGLSRTDRKPTLSDLDGGFVKGDHDLGVAGNEKKTKVEPYSQQPDDSDENVRRRGRGLRFKKREQSDDDAAAKDAATAKEGKAKKGKSGKSEKVDIKALNAGKGDGEAAPAPAAPDDAFSAPSDYDGYLEPLPEPTPIAAMETPAQPTHYGAPPVDQSAAPYAASQPLAPPSREEVEEYRIRLENRLLERYNNLPEHAGNVAKVSVILSKPLEESIDGTRIRAEFDQLVYDPWGKRLPALEKEYYVVVFGSGGVQQVRSDPSIRVGLDMEKVYSERAPLAADPFRNVSESDAFRTPRETPMPDWWRPEP